jgi:uncharacterized phage protein (predicted DNA packaging)
MNLVSLELAKKHLRITHDAEDELITGYIAAASRKVEEYLETVFEEGAELDPLVIHACLLYLGSLYYQRESSVQGGVVDTRAAERLLYPLRERVL